MLCNIILVFILIFLWREKYFFFHVNKSAVITKADFFVADLFCGTNIHLNIFDEDLKCSVFKTNACLV